MSKPIGDVISQDLPAVIATIRFMAECIDKVDGAVTSTESGVVHMVLREPYGVVGAISPWRKALTEPATSEPLPNCRPVGFICDASVGAPGSRTVSSTTTSRPRRR